MGQYYKIINVDKEECLTPWDFGNGAKLMEFSYNKNDLVLAFMNLLNGDWKGDRVYVVGDYSEPDDPNECWTSTCKEVLDEMNERYGDVEEEYGNLYKVAADKFKSPECCNEEDHGFEYIYNLETEEFVNLNKCPVEWTYYNEQEDNVYLSKISPLTLLLAMGNGRGGGDYHKDFNNFDMVGKWCETSYAVGVSDTYLSFFDSYTELTPDFTENRPVIPWNQEEEEIEKCLAEGRKRNSYKWYSVFIYDEESGTSQPVQFFCENKSEAEKNGMNYIEVWNLKGAYIEKIEQDESRILGR